MPVRAAAVGIALVAAAALLLQYALLLDAATDGIGSATVRFFSYFTILSNLLVACACGSVAMGRDGAFFARPAFLGAVALYIAITGIVYATILQSLWQPQGAQWWADTALHYIVPVAYVGWWLFGIPHGRLHWTDLAWWLSFPLLYLLWALWRGSWANEYPYPFIDAGALGMAGALRNAVLVTIGFVALGALLVACDRVPGRRRND